MNPLPSPTSGRVPRLLPAESADRSRPPESGQRAWPTAPSELACLVEDYADLLVWHAFRLLGSMPDAEDVVQDVFIRVFSTVRCDEVASVRAYLYRAVGNACTDFLRSRTRPTAAANRSTSIGSPPAPTARPSPRRPSRNATGSRPCSGGCRASRPRRSGSASSTGCDWTRSPRSSIARSTPSAPACATASRSCATRSDEEERTHELP